MISVFKISGLLADTLRLKNLLLVVTRWDGGLPGRMGGRLFFHVNAVSRELLSELKTMVRDALQESESQGSE